ncbi:MAG: phage holin family protein [Chitinophagales bacterium]
MEELKNRTEEVADHVGEYVETIFSLLSTSVTQKAVNTSSVLLTKLLIFLFYIFAVLFIGAAAAWWLGNLVHNRIFGFLIVTGIFLITAFLFAAIQKNSLIPFFRNRIVRKIYE